MVIFFHSCLLKTLEFDSFVSDTYKALARVFDHVSKHRERKLKNKAQLSFLTKVRGVWKHDQTLPVQDCLIQRLKQIHIVMYFSRINEGERLANLCKHLIMFPNPSRL